MVNEDFSVFFNSDEFAVEAWIGGIGVKGILESSYSTVHQVKDCKFKFTCAQAAIPLAAVGDNVLIEEHTYLVLEAKPDGTGLLMLTLESTA